MESLLELVFGIVLEGVYDLVIRPHWRALHTRHGGWVLFMTWVVSAIWFCYGWRLGMSGRDGFPLSFAITSVLAAPAFAMISTIRWTDGISAARDESARRR